MSDQLYRWKCRSGGAALPDAWQRDKAIANGVLVPVEPDAVIEVDGSILAEILGVSGSGTYAVLIRTELDNE